MGFIIGLDQTIEEYLFTARSAFGVDFFTAVSWLGEWKILVVACLVLAMFFWLRNKKDFILPFLLVIFGSEISGQILKIIFHRPRPVEAVELENTFSFPSGHALISMAFFGFLVYFIWQNNRNRTVKIFSLAVGSLIILAVGFSRLYLGMHYLSDVLGGFIFGGIWLAVGIYLKKK